MTHITFLWVDKTKFAWLREGIEFYRKRLTHYVRVEVREAPAGPTPKIEGDNLLKLIPKGSLIFALDIKGDTVNSSDLARLLAGLETAGHSHFCFIIGGAYGLSQEVLQSAHRRLSLSSLTFTHDMSRLILMEQLYRAYSIIAGAPYHH
ncbi:MAG: 23S rRNA (pseudouridine(1915)-N(3))-methyltransferase RlmH [Dissulfuribacterales bacterium]